MKLSSRFPRRSYRTRNGAQMLMVYEGGRERARWYMQANIRDPRDFGAMLRRSRFIVHMGGRACR